MKQLDRYILRQFIITAFFALAAFTVIFLAVDMMENLDDFIDHNAPVNMIVTYYLYFMPEIIKLIIPVAMLMSALFTTGRLSTFNELTALKSSGVSLYRLMAPLLIFSLLVSAASVYFNGWIVPSANKKKFAISRTYFKKGIEYFSKTNIFVQDSPTRIISLGEYNDATSSATLVSVQEFDPLDPTILISRYDAREMLWDQFSDSWTLNDGTTRIFTNGKEFIKRFDSFHFSGLHFSPDDVKKKQQHPDEMDYTSLKKFIDNQKRAGQDIARWQVDYYGKIAFPFASFIVVLFGVPFSSVKRRSGLGVEFGIAVAICFFYMIFLKVSQAFGYNGDLHPVLTAWLANIIFLLGGLWNMVRVQK
ncbi:MAG: LPS export ABC transporter permease LptG [Bacteroidetes bacterium]|nr:MAG: LPS export ABC transporter permease LptG [Bacteroidota bacterium]